MVTKTWILILSVFIFIKKRNFILKKNILEQGYMILDN